MQPNKILKPTDVTLVIDTREQCPFDLSPFPTEIATLTTGDYSLKGFESEVSIERKSLDDLCGVVGSSRERFEKEIKRLQGYPQRCLIVESSWEEIKQGRYRSAVNPESVFGSLIGWQAAGIPVIMAGSHSFGSECAKRFLWISARRYWRKFQLGFDRKLRNFYADTIGDANTENQA